jgi:hypothetical protein
MCFHRKSRREELEALARHYHHLQNEYKPAPPDSARRRRLEDRLLDVRERFDRVLEEWVPDDGCGGIRRESNSLRPASTRSGERPTPGAAHSHRSAA